MPSTSSARLDLPYLAAGQLEKHVTVNEALTRLDALSQTAVISRSTTAQPATPEDGDLYILPAGRSGSSWSGLPIGALVRAEFGAWVVVAATDGLIAYVEDEHACVVRHGVNWTPLSLRDGTAQRLSRIGLATDADATNPFAALLNKALWTAKPTSDGGDGSLRFTFNKQTSGDVGSILFQTGYEGRAEIGLIGDDDLTLKVSNDGSTWREAMRIDANDGHVVFPHGAARCESTLVPSSSSFAVPAWARAILITAVGGGGGGRPGGFGTGGVRLGGSGGGAGGLSQVLLSTADLAGVLTLNIGAGGGSGHDGGETTVISGGAVILTAKGGASGGSGGAGLNPGNDGGTSSSTAAGSAGGSLASPASPGGGGGGGGLDAGGTAFGGGAGGSGGALLRAVSGGADGSSSYGGAGSVAASPGLSPAGGGGGGGGAASVGAGFAGGAGGGYGAGGGGGGAGISAGGAGGGGASGVVLIRCFG